MTFPLSLVDYEILVKRPIITENRRNYVSFNKMTKEEFAIFEESGHKYCIENQTKDEWYGVLQIVCFVDTDILYEIIEENINLLN